METMITFAGVTVATLVALFAALALQTLLLKATFLLMQPITNQRSAMVSSTSQHAAVRVEHGARLLAQAYGKTR